MRNVQQNEAQRDCIDEGRGGEALCRTACVTVRCLMLPSVCRKPTTGQDHCFVGAFLFVNVNQLAQEIGGVYVVVDRGDQLSFIEIQYQLSLQEKPDLIPLQV